MQRNWEGSSPGFGNILAICPTYTPPHSEIRNQPSGLPELPNFSQRPAAVGTCPRGAANATVVPVHSAMPITPAFTNDHIILCSESYSRPVSPCLLAARSLIAADGMQRNNRARYGPTVPSQDYSELNSTIDTSLISSRWQLQSWTARTRLLHVASMATFQASAPVMLMGIKYRPLPRPRSTCCANAGMRTFSVNPAI